MLIQEIKCGIRL